MSALYLVETQGAGQRLEHVPGHVGLTPLLNSAVVVRAQTRQHGQLSEGVTDAIRAAGGRSEFLAVDLAGSYGGIRAFADDARSALGGRVDILVNNAGVYPATLTADLPDAALDDMLAVNVPGNEGHRAQLDQMTAGTPAGVVVQPDDIAKGVAYLVSDDAQMIHGTTL